MVSAQTSSNAEWARRIYDERLRTTLEAGETGKVVTPGMVHIFYMSALDPSKACASYGAVGPAEF